MNVEIGPVEGLSDSGCEVTPVLEATPRAFLWI